jgi:hypothetical protein
MEEPKVTQTYVRMPDQCSPAGRTYAYVDGVGWEGQRSSANNDQGRLYPSEGASIVGGVDDAARRCGGAG